MGNINWEKKVEKLILSENPKTNLTINTKNQVEEKLNSKEIMEKNLKLVFELLNKRMSFLNSLKNWIDKDWEERKILDDFLDFLEIPKNEKSRFAAFKRIVELREDNIKILFWELEFDEKKKEQLTAKAYQFVSDYHNNLHINLINDIENKNLLTPFYLELLKQTHQIGIAFNKFQIAWQRELIDWVNKRLEERFWNDTVKIMSYFKENNLFDLWHNQEEADRSYSVLKEKWESYEKLSYVEYFTEEVWEIIKKLDNFILNLEKHDDKIYNQKEPYINYIKAIKEAFSEKDTDKLVEKWSLVDVAWMSVKWPFQITHPLEYYEDKYRKAVAPEWDLRLKNDFLFESNVKSNIFLVFEKIFLDKWILKYENAYNFSKHNIENVSLYISSLLLYYWSRLSWLASAQVIPNDSIVSKKYGKKIFSFANEILKMSRNSPVTKFSTNIFEKELFEKSKKFIFWPDENFYKVYDIQTIWHEYWHTLWLDIDTEQKMNQNWNFKNIEEWKATTWWLVSFFNNPDKSIIEDLIVSHIVRTIWIVKRMKIWEVIPYYTESLIHLKLLFDSKIISLNSEKKIKLNLSDENLENLKKIYFDAYYDLVDTYLEKKNADEFLYKYVINENWIFFPKDEYLREFSKYSYNLYEKFWNEIDENN